MGIFGIGVDAVEISRMEDGRLSEHVMRRLFHESEYHAAMELPHGTRAQYLASRFAAKEAFVKAMGTGFRNMAPSEIAVKNDASGRPSLVLYGNTLEQAGRGWDVLHVSLTHEGALAIAFVVLETVEHADGQK